MSVSPSTHRNTHHGPPGTSHGTVLIPTHGSPGIPHSVWLPPKNASHSPAFTGSALPAWALDRACAQFAPQGGPAALLLPPGPGYTERTAHPTGAAPAWLAAAQPADLADTGRARLALALVLADPTPDMATDPQHMAGFFAEIRAALRPDAPLLIHTHPQHTKDGMHDPAGTLLHAARAAGFVYTQHLVLVHHRLITPPPTRRAHRAPQHGPVHRRAHSDLYLLTTPQTAGSSR
jgi:hypothetical protein